MKNSRLYICPKPVETENAANGEMYGVEGPAKAGEEKQADEKRI